MTREPNFAVTHCPAAVPAVRYYLDAVETG